MVGAIQDGRLSGASSTIAQQYQSSPRSRNFLRCERTSPKETLPTPWTGLFSVPSNLYFESLSMLNARLMHAAANGNVKDVRKLLLKGALFTKDQDGNTALHEASRNGYAEVVHLLLKASCYADGYNYKGMNSLHLAAQQGHADVVKTLLKHKANPLLANQHGETALHIASKYSQPEIISAFAESGANMNVIMENGDTALHVAAKYGNLSVLRTLLVAESNPFIRNKDGWLAYETAERFGQTEAKVLLECLMQEKCKDYRPRSMQQQKDPPPDRSRQMDDGESDIVKRRKSKLFASFKNSFTRLRRSSTSSSVAAVAGEGPCNETGDLLNGGDVPKKSGNDSRGVENGKVASMNHERSLAQLEQRRSIQFSEPENRTYESVDEVATKVSFYKRPVTAKLQPTPGTGPPQLATASGMGIGIRPSHLGMENVPDPPDQQQRESVDEYVVMAPSTPRGNASYDLQWDTGSNKQAATRSILHSTLSTSSCSPTTPVDLQDELDTMRKAFEIRLTQLEKRYQRHLERVGDTPPPLPAPRPRLPTWGPSSTQEPVHTTSLHHSRKFSSALRFGPVGADIGLNNNQSLPFAASSSYLPGMGYGQTASSVFKRSGSADLLDADVPLRGRLQSQQDRLGSYSSDRITTLAGSLPPPPPVSNAISDPPRSNSPVMIDSVGLLSGDSDDSLIESLLDAQIGPQPEQGHDTKQPWFVANTCSQDPGDSMAVVDVSTSSGRNDSLNNTFQSNTSGYSGKEGSSLLKWVPRQEAKAKLKEKLKAHKQKSLEQLQIQESLGEGPKVPPSTTYKVPVKTGQNEGNSSNLQEKIKKLEGIIKEQKQTLV